MGTAFRNIVLLIIVVTLILYSYMSYSSLYTERIISSGIFGKVILGPVKPFFGGQISGGNYIPYAAEVTILTADGSDEVTAFTADANGSFKVFLEPGTYLLRPEPGGPVFPRAESKVIEIEKERLTQVDIVYDTGVR